MLKRALLAVAAGVLLLGGTPASPADTDLGPYRRIKLIKVVDGDTVEISVQTWLDTTVYARVRLTGVNTPELHSKRDCERKAAVAAKSFTEAWMAQSGISLTVHRWDKYGGRVDGSFNRGDESLADALIKSGQARPYRGEKRGPWCQENNR